MAIPDAGGGEDATPEAVPTFPLFIGGEWVEGTAGATFESRNPADRRDLIGRFQAGNAADTARAVRAAEEALPSWRATPARERAEVLPRFATLLAEQLERVARAVTRETGIVLREAHREVQDGIDFARFMADEGRHLTDASAPSEAPERWATSVRAPLGVAGIITPWCSPIAIPCSKLMAALVAGNTVVFKPASRAAHSATLLIELLAAAGFPPGTVNLVTGSGRDVGDPIVESRDIHVISFTGRTATGRGIATRAGRQLRRLSLELGAKNAVAVLSDADLDLAVDGIVSSAFEASGQRCTACSRVVVDRRVLSPLLERLEARTRALRLGPGLQAGVDVGPLIDEAALASMAEYVEIGRTEGDLVCGGSTASHGELANGWFFEPTVFTDVMPMARIAQEEIFGPVLAVIPVDGYDEIVGAVNGVRSGLAAAIYTRDTATGWRAISDFDTGIVRVNGGTTGAEPHLRYGGWKESGNGRGGAGVAALDTFTEWKNVSVGDSGRLPTGRIHNLPG